VGSEMCIRDSVMALSQLQRAMRLQPQVEADSKARIAELEAEIEKLKDGS